MSIDATHAREPRRSPTMHEHGATGLVHNRGAAVVWATTVFTFTAVAADVTRHRVVYREATDVETVLRVALASAMWAIPLAGLLALVVALFTTAAYGTTLFRGRLRGARGLLAAMPVAILTAVVAQSLLSGPGISSKPWVSAARAASGLAAVVLPAAAAALLGRALGAPRRHATLMTGCALGAIAILLALPVVDVLVFPQLYRVGHLGLWFGVACASLGIGAMVAVLRGARGRGAPLRIHAGFLALVVLIGLVARPLDDTATRAQAFGGTQFLRRVLSDIVPPPPEPPLRIDRALLDRLLAGAHADREALDAILPARRNFNLIFLTVDALRADRLGRARTPPLTPNLDRLFAKAARFTHAWTPYPSTRFAFGSIFRGRDPSATDIWAAAHGATRSRQPTLAGILGTHGRITEAITGFPGVLVSELLPNRGGFGNFNAHPVARGDRHAPTAEEVTASAIEALDRAGETPFFLWVHYFDPHHPYSPPCGNIYGESTVDRYDAEVHYADQHLGDFLDALSRRGRMGNTVIVSFADHGEELGEQGLDYHGVGLSERELHVPLAIEIPGIPGRDIATTVSLIDLLPTVTDLVGIDAPPTPGARSLLPHILNAGSSEPGVVFAELDDPILGPVGRQFAVREGNLKLIVQPGTGSIALFDLGTDPTEVHDLARERSSEVARMRNLLDACRARGMTERDGDPDSEPTNTSESLNIALQSHETIRKLWALDTILAATCPKGSLPLIVDLARNASDEAATREVRRRCVRVLTDSGDPEAVAAALGRGEDPDAGVRAEVGVARARAHDGTWRTLFPPGPLTCSTDVAMAWLRAALWSGDTVARERALDLLASRETSVVDARDLFRALAVDRGDSRLASALDAWAAVPEGRPMVDALLRDAASGRRSDASPASRPGRPDSGSSARGGALPTPLPAPATKNGGAHDSEPSKPHSGAPIAGVPARSETPISLEVEAVSPPAHDDARVLIWWKIARPVDAPPLSTLGMTAEITWLDPSGRALAGVPHTFAAVPARVLASDATHFGAVRVTAPSPRGAIPRVELRLVRR